MITVYFNWKDCKRAFTYCSSIPIFSVGGGSYDQFGGSVVEMKQKHFYFLKWCFLTIRYDRIPKRKFRFAFGSSYKGDE